MSFFANKLTELMKSHDVSDQKLADDLNISRTTVLRWRKGERSPKLNKISEIAKYFSITPEELIGESSKKSKENLSPNQILVASHIDDDVTEEEMNDILRYIELIKNATK
ncbi:helix-turn-helix transcriptional regulator [Carnobacterium divergens]|uniref:helix-turn-helix domain-containing protein n=1 Tax=Carnobacterium divergens TaxID=2748 RepID=UPI0028909ED2|nr:helix-turn-helix transcriptional regulator [Carnobacterium divergens]MDT2011221.1 helix-turn-helix domain-containing protein [Carnobacterium divergens]